jgi:Flp pilus assembly protein TadG
MGLGKLKQPRTRPSQASCHAGRSGRERERGQALAELSIVITLMLVMALAAFDLGRAFHAYLTVVQAARDGARVAMDCTKSESDVIQAARDAAAPLTVVVTVNRPSCPGAATVTVSYALNSVTPATGIFWSGSSTVNMSASMKSR